MVTYTYKYKYVQLVNDVTIDLRRSHAAVNRAVGSQPRRQDKAA